jgi:polyvinyl alcohol dehydrogenase (cytochrome)
MNIRRFAAVGAALALAVAMSVAGAGPAGADTAAWPMGGHDLQNTRSNPAQTTVSAANAYRLATKWQTTTHGDVSATPAVVGNAVYFPDWGGFLTKVDARTGATIWSKELSDYGYNSAPGLFSRTTPAVVGNVLYLGDQGGGMSEPHPGRVLAVDARNGNLLWSTVINPHPFSIVTQSPIVANGTVYVGASSAEEGNAALIPGYECCTFRGSFSALDAATGQIKWTTYMVPDNGGVPGGYTGAAVWGSTPSLDARSGTVYVTTGNNYTVPDSVKACQDNGGSPSDCLSPADHVDAIVALATGTGAIKWATGVQGFDDWIVSCIPQILWPNPCPTATPGPDFDFGSGPILYSVKKPTGGFRQLVGAGAKSGIFWALDARTGQIVWSTEAGPGSTLGGIEWGSAYDGVRIYIAEANFGFLPYPNDPDLPPVGSWAALDPATGAILWQTSDPSGSFDTGAVSVSNGVLYASSMSGHMYALDARSGAVLKDIPGEGSSNAGPAIDNNGVVYWGNGYGRFGVPATTFYAFSLDGR